MGQRLELQAMLENVLGTNNVYFQPPANVLMEYPCIIYKRDKARTRFAGNAPYRHTKGYLVTFVSQDPDSEIPDKLAALPMCIFDRHYAVKNLNHDVFSLFF
jgi:hypothetical protein